MVRLITLLARRSWYWALRYLYFGLIGSFCITLCRGDLEIVCGHVEIVCDATFEVKATK